jgi:predicted transcriptional regulator
MAKVVTVRLSDEDYRRISAVAKIERRPISNLMTLMVVKGIEEGVYVDAVEMDQITSDKRLMAKLQAGHREAAEGKGRWLSSESSKPRSFSAISSRTFEDNKLAFSRS